MRTKTSAFNAGSSLVPIKETVEFQAEIYSKHPILKVIGMVTLAAFLLLPYFVAKNHWSWLESLFEGNKFWMILTTCILLSHIVHSTTCISYAIIYKLRLPFFEQFKDNPNPWPWEYDPNFSKQIWRGIKLVCFNNFVISPLGFIFAIKVGLLDVRITAEELPSFWIYIAQVFYHMFWEDAMFYQTHKLLHHPKLYPYIHKIHHEFYDTICISSEFAHPVEFLLGNVLPVGLGSILLFGKGHLLSLLVFIAFRLFETVESHCGYDFPWAVTRAFPFSVTSTYHNYHHLKNIGNFGSFLIMWDSIFGTNTAYYKELQNSESPYSKLLSKPHHQKTK